MHQVQRQVDFDIEEPSDEELRRRYEDESLKLYSTNSGNNKKHLNRTARSKRHKSQRKARRLANR